MYVSLYLKKYCNIVVVTFQVNAVYYYSILFYSGNILSNFNLNKQMYYLRSERPVPKLERPAPMAVCW